MSHYEQFLPTEVRASIDEVRALDTVPDSVIDRLIERILKAGEAKTTSLQLDLERIELSFERRYGLLETKLITDNQARSGDIYQMLSDVRGAQLIAHPQIEDLRKAFEDMNIWGSRLEAAFIAGRDYAASERVRIEAKVDDAIERIEAIESILEINEPTPAAEHGE